MHPDTMNKHRLRRLPAQGILIGLFLIFTIPFGIIVNRLITEIDGNIEIASREQMGVRYNTAIRQVMEQVVKHQQLADANYQGVATLKSRFLEQQSQVDRRMHHLAAVNQELGSPLAVTALWQKTQQRWQTLKQRSQTVPVEEDFQLHKDLLASLLELNTAIADNSNLVLDPQLDSYYLMSTLTMQLPIMVDASASAREIAVRIASRQRMPKNEEVELLVLSREIEAPLNTVQRGITVAYKANPALQPLLQPSLQASDRSSQAFLSYIRRTIARTERFQKSEVLRVGNQAIADQFRLYDATAPALDRLLQQRVESLVGKQQQIRWFGILVLMTVLAAFLAIARNFKQRRQGEQRLSVQYAVTQVLAASATLEEAMPKVLQTICQTLNWNYAELWLATSKTQQLTLAYRWSDPELNLRQFEAANPPTNLLEGEGLLGQIWRQQALIWITNLETDPRCVQKELLEIAGLRTGFGFPILNGDRIQGAITCWSQKKQRFDPKLLPLTSTLGNQIGQFLRRRQIEETLQGIAQSISGAIGAEFFTALVCHLAATLKVDYAFVGKLVGTEQNRIATVAVCQDGEVVENFEYELIHNPCDRLQGNESNCHLECVQQRFPKGKLLAELQIESFRGVPLNSSSQEPLGLLAVMNRSSIADPNLVDSLLTIFAARAAAELERQQAELILREQEELLRMALSAARMGAWDWNIVTGEEKWSREVAEIFGFDPTALNVHYADFLQRIHPDDRPLVETIQNRTLETGTEYNAEYRVLWEDGSLRWVNSRGNVVRDIDGTPIMLTGTTIDITDRKRSEAALREAEEKYRSIFENAADGIFQTTPEGQYLSANPALARIYGYHSPEDLMAHLSGQLQQLYVDPDRRAEFLHLIDQYGSVMDFESQVYRKDGSSIWITENARAVRDSQGRLQCYEGIVKDISDRKLAAEELFRAKETAEAANHAKSQFLANMSHELRTPLNAIIGYSEMLQEDAQDLGVEELAPDLQKIHGAGKHLLGLINDILDISKIEAGRMELYLEEFNLVYLIADVQATVQPLIAKNCNSLQVEVSPDLGIIYADMTKVRQVLFNLLSNASKFTEDGTITLTVRNIPPASAAAPLPQVVFQVTDTGIGIAPEQLEHLFQPFTQADASTTRKYGGTGLGLAISRRFCQMMGGDIAVTSEVGAGSTVTFWLPMRTGDRPLEEVESTVALAEIASSPQFTVLVVDDDASVRDLMVRHLSREGFRVETAANGEEGLHLVHTLRPHAITLDVMMPKMDGWTVLSALKADPELADIPVVILTMVDDQNLGFTLGASDYLTKPIDYHKLITILRKYEPSQEMGMLLSVGEVLIAEDDSTTREMFRRILEKEGWIVKEAETGRVALEQIRDHPPDLILLDLMMPEMDGFQLITALRSQPECRQIPVVVITAMDLTAADRQRLNGSVEQVLQKGTRDREILLQEVKELVCASIRRHASMGERTNG